jgi:hypothetical protein
MQTKISKTNTVYQLSIQDLAKDLLCIKQAIAKQENNCHGKTLMYILSTNAITITNRQITCMQIT